MDKVPHKKNHLSLRRPVLLMILLGLLALCLGAILLLNATQPMPDMPEQAKTIWLLPRASQEIQSVTHSNRGSTPYTLQRDADGRFTLAEKPSIPLRSTLLEQLMDSLNALYAVHLVADAADSPLHLADFGLEPPQAWLTIRYQDGEEITLLIGKEAVSDVPQTYCMLGGGSRVYTLYTDLTEPFYYEADYLRDFTQPELDAALLDRIDITGDITFSLSYTPSGWQQHTPFSYPLAKGRTDYLLSQIESMAFESCLGTPEEVDMDALGLTNPCLTVRLTQAASVISGVTAEGEAVSLDVPEITYTLLLGHETGKSGVYLQWEGMVYKASNFLLGFWKTLEPASFLLTSPINFLINDLIALSLETPTHTRSYTVQMVESITENNQIATDEYGQILYDALIYRAGDAEPMNAETFLSWYVSLAELAPSGKVDASYQPLGEPLAALTLQSQSVTRRLAFYPYDALHMALSLDGECLYYVERSFLTALNAAP